MNRKVDSEFRQRYISDLHEIDPKLACKFSTLPKDTQRRWISLMADYGIKVREAVRALREYLNLIPNGVPHELEGTPQEEE